MQQQHRMEEYDEELNQGKEQMSKIEEEKGRAFNELREKKKVAEETNVMFDEVVATKRNSDPHTREHQMGVEDNNSIESSSEHESKNGLELQLSEKDALLDNMRNEMDSLRSSEDDAMVLLSDYKRKVQELEAELDKRKESEANLFDTLVMQTKQLEHNKVLLEESKLEISSLEGKIKEFQVSATQTMKIPGESQLDSESSLSTKESIEGMKTETELEEEKLNLNGTQDGEGLSTNAKTLLQELDLLKNELKSATVAEENSKKAMDDLAFALKEVATEANQAKAKLTISEVELEHTKGDAERWRTMLESTEEKYKELLEATKKEADRYKNTAERLRLEAEETLLAWNGKETELVNCIRRAEEERLHATKETTGLLELLKEAENKTKVSKEENQKLRDILKQALNEANVAKEAAEIAKAENARLQDSLNLLVHENEMLKIHEAASFENIKELKRMLSESSMKDFKIEDIEKSTSKEGSKEDKESGRKAKAQNTHNSADKDHKESKSLNKTFSLNLKDMIPPRKEQHKVGNEEANKEIDDDTLRGSIFDEVDSSDSESRHDGEMGIPDDFDHLDESHFDDSEGDRNSRKRRALLRRFGDLIRRRSFHYHRKDPSNEEHLQT
ncbi:putative WEB family protein At1g65010, chloroplastic [Abrus precatorius]|uniref:WEB family protein At1g65010, chloroplastic n=1 Tax=Abrus precatorius TaxID=3816 RepID=A0A8B8JZH6_ABRPR|nr:putative WEB family protein At1g65010, chloroplastic [Abrus precatorius]